MSDVIKICMCINTNMIDNDVVMIIIDVPVIDSDVPVVSYTHPNM